MIVYDLICGAEHRFEAWFASNEDFERQQGTPMLVCPVCGHNDVRRLPAGINLAKRERKASAPAATATAEEASEQEHLAAFSNPRHVLAALRKVLNASENVGERFPEEARRIHYGEAPKRSIRGQASREEAEALRDEGIEVFNLPVPPTEDLH